MFELGTEPERENSEPGSAQRIAKGARYACTAAGQSRGCSLARACTQRRQAPRGPAGRHAVTRRSFNLDLTSLMHAAEEHRLQQEREAAAAAASPSSARSDTLPLSALHASPSAPQVRLPLRALASARGP